MTRLQQILKAYHDNQERIAQALAYNEACLAKAIRIHLNNLANAKYY